MLHTKKEHERNMRMWTFWKFERNQMQLWRSSLKNSSGLTVSSTSPWFSVELLVVQDCTETWIFNHSPIAEKFSRAGNFEAPRKLRWSSAHLPHLRLFRGSTQIAGAGSSNRASIDSNILHSPLFDYKGDSHARRRSRILWWWPHTTHRLPWFLANFDCS